MSGLAPSVRPVVPSTHADRYLTAYSQVHAAVFETVGATAECIPAPLATPIPAARLTTSTEGRRKAGRRPRQARRAARSA